MTNNPKYNFKKIEVKWQKIWDKKKTYVAKNGSARPKKYVLAEFPYPSGEGLHMGHLRPYVAGDTYSRYMRMKSFEVMYPMGWDAFGLPAENFAIKKGIHPSISTAKNIKNAKAQVKSWGIGFDWSREVNTTDPKYYKWTQWIFLQLYKAGLAYESTGFINWCPKDKTGLANEEVVGGLCERCGTKVEQKEMKQWYLKITAYAEKLLKGLEKVNWPEQVKVQQENWIGKSEGAEIEFAIKGTNKKIKVFTTRPDTLFGATYMVISPEHALIGDLSDKISNLKEVKKYITQSKNKTEEDRTQNKKKTGVEIKGIKAINPANKEEIPVWIADYVLSGYGTGAIMAVPAHDERDFEFAKKFGLSIREVVLPNIIDRRNPPVKGKKTVERKNVHAIVKDPKSGKYLALKWKKYDWVTFPMGGVEDGEDVVEAAKREVREETGFKNLRLVRILEGQARAEYFAKHKDENRVSFTTAVVFELIDNKQDEVIQEEKEAHEVIWLDSSKLNYENMTHAEIELWKEKLSSGSGVYVRDGVLISSEKFTGMDSEKAKSEITKLVGGKKKIQYHLRDWVFSRQRYWGEPIPLIHCGKCGVVPVAEKDLPVKLPPVKKYEPTGTGESPLAAVKSWVNVKCPKCKSQAKRETNTMPQWAGSSWYYLRYVDPKNSKKIAGQKELKYWLPVDSYFGGMEHTTLHLLYSRFWHQFLYDLKVVPTPEPYYQRIPHGIILGPDGEKMSKSRGNVVNPNEIVKNFGADTLRMYEMFLGPHEATVSWSDGGILGISRFLERVWRIAHSSTFTSHGFKEDPLEKELQQTIRKVTSDIENIRYNTAISALMIFLNELEKNKQIRKFVFERFLLLLAPFAPHITEELWAKFKNKKSIHQSEWPKYDEKLATEDTFTLVIQVNGKVKDTVELERGISEEEVKSLALGREKVRLILQNREPRAIIYVPNRLINIVI